MKNGSGIDWMQVARELHDELECIVRHCNQDAMFRDSLVRQVAFEALRKFDRLTGSVPREIS